MRATAFEYSPGTTTPPWVKVSKDKDTLDDGVLKSKIEFDGFGRKVSSILYQGNWSTIASRTDTQYDALGRTWKVSNPHTGTAEWTETSYDALDRVVKVTHPDSSHADTAYAGTRRR